jgi:hypothetical protein
MVSEPTTTTTNEIPPSAPEFPLSNTEIPSSATTSPFEFTFTSSAFNNHANPFYLPHGDGPGAILVSQPLIGENYNT